MFSISLFDRGIVSRVSWRLKHGLLYTSSHCLVGLIKLCYQLGFLFLLKVIDLSCIIFV